MKAKKSMRALMLILPLLFMTSCKPAGPSSEVLLPPTDYEIDENITNKNGGVYYEIFVRSFADSNKDGKGDLRGIADKIPYLETLGVKGLWLTPIHPSPSYHGYDVTDYLAIHNDFGTLEDFDYLIEVANAHNIDIILDLVINHTGRSHPWFVEGRKRFNTPEYDPNDPYDKGNYYAFYVENGQVKVKEGVFGDHMPELLLDNPAVKEEVTNISKFWLDRGVKGFRLDAAGHFFDRQNDNIEFLSWFSDMVKGFRSDAYIVAEAWTNFNMQKYYYAGVDSLFNFDAANATGFIIDNILMRSGPQLSYYISNAFSEAYAINENAQMAMFLSNHDMDRSSAMFTADQEERQKLAASVYLLTPGVPFMYYGEEIGIKGSRQGANTDANRRLPMIWKRVGDKYRTDPPFGTTYDFRKQVKYGADDLIEEPFSLLNHYRKVINIRNTYPWINNARILNLKLGNNGVSGLTLKEHKGENELHVVHNLLAEEVIINLNRFIKDYEVEIIHDIYTTGTRAILEDGNLTLSPYSSVVLRRK